jgi:hypothetical protein
MMRLYLVERNGGRRLDLGAYKYNDLVSCMVAARRRHPFVIRMERTRAWDYEGVPESGPLRHPTTAAPRVMQADMFGGDE